MSPYLLQNTKNLICAFHSTFFILGQTLRKIIGNSKHYADALHLWVCELNEVEYFVTDDSRFRRYVENTLQFGMKTKIIGPIELLKINGIKEIPFPKERFKYALSVLDLDD